MATDNKTLDELLRRLYHLEKKETEITRKMVGMNNWIAAVENQQGTTTNLEMENELYGIKKKLEHVQFEVQYLRIKGMEKKRSVCEQLAMAMSSVVGLREAAFTRLQWQRYTWALFFFVGTIAMAYALCATIIEYVREPAFIKIKLENSPLYEYPPLVFCQEGWFDTKKAIDIGLSEDSLKYSLGYLNYNNQLEIAASMEAKKEFLTTFRRYRFRSLSDYYKAISIDLEVCHSEDQFYTSTVSAYLASEGRDLATKVFLPSVGFCYLFNIPAADGRLGVLYEPERILVKYQNKINNFTPISRNWMLYLSIHQTASSSWPLSVKADTQNFLSIRAEKYVSINRPNAICHSEGKDTSNYSFANCMAECQNRYLKEIIKCQLFWITNGESLESPEEFCNSFDEILSNWTLENDVIQKKTKLISEAKESCFEECPPKCERTCFAATSFENGVTLKNVRVSKEIDNVRRSGSNESITAIFVRHESIIRGGTMIITETNAYSVIELINHIGGTLNIFIGGSLLTIIQLIMFLIDYHCREGEVAVYWR